MNNVEVNRIAAVLTKPQRDVLLMLDGPRINELELPLVYRRVVNNLHAKGLVRYMVRPTIHIHGRRVIGVSLTTIGSDLIYNGGLDR